MAVSCKVRTEALTGPTGKQYKETPQPVARGVSSCPNAGRPGLGCAPTNRAAPRVDDMVAKRTVPNKSPSRDTRITLRGREITHHRTVARPVRQLRIVQSARRPLSLQRSPSGP